MNNEHGHLKISINRRMIRVDMSGGFNVEGARSSGRIILPAMEKLAVNSWLMLHHYEGLVMATPDTYEHIRNQFEKCIAANCIGLISVTQFDTVKTMVSKTLKALPIPIEFVGSLPEAEALARDMLQDKQFVLPKEGIDLVE